MHSAPVSRPAYGCIWLHVKVRGLELSLRPICCTPDLWHKKRHCSCNCGLWCYMSVICFCLVHRGVLPFLDLPQEVEGQPIPEEEARTTPPRLYDVQINSGWFWLTKFLINYVQILTLINRLITNTATHAAPVCGEMVSTSTRLLTPEEWKAELAWLSDL